jgi:Ni,Fe-hydrogenase III large subunit
MSASLPISAARTEPCLPWPRHVLSHDEWVRMAAALASDPSLVLLALWADTMHVHALLFDNLNAPLLISTETIDNRYPALSPTRPLAVWFERMVHDLWGHGAEGGVDARPWLDHGHWPHIHPLSLRFGPPGTSEPPEFIATDEEGLHQVPLGPVHGGIETASHLRITALGETVVRLESRLGYTHKGTLALLRGKSPRAAARFAARLAAEHTVAHSLAFARAAETALATEAPPRAVALRAVMAEIERITGHLGDLEATAEAVGWRLLAARCCRHREVWHRAAEAAFGHRLMMDCVVPGGVAVDVAVAGASAIGRASSELADEMPEWEHGLESAALTGVGAIPLHLVQALAAGGPAGRASGRDCDVRRFLAFEPYASLNVRSPVLDGGDAEARVRIRLTEIGESIRLLRSVLDNLPAGELSVALPAESGEGIGWAEGSRGDAWHWLRLDHGQIATAFARDPCWPLWPLLESAAVGSSLSDVPLLKASLGLSSSGVDL